MALKSHKKKNIENDWSPINAITNLSGSDYCEEKFSDKKINTIAVKSDPIFHEVKNKNKKSEDFIESIDLIPWWVKV